MERRGREALFKEANVRKSSLCRNVTWPMSVRSCYHTRSRGVVQESV